MMFDHSHHDPSPIHVGLKWVWEHLKFLIKTLLYIPLTAIFGYLCAALVCFSVTWIARQTGMGHPAQALEVIFGYVPHGVGMISGLWVVYHRVRVFYLHVVPS